ncbi:hypothetical protein [Rosenbergiella nectarea]|uniref:hypothetical protein n=1 Tax=Rosenbergiella nectarea TaxID=988801 RepID=UPI001F4E67F7|nr:hypothetical protein [Rosenbergiella nectarea]
MDESRKQFENWFESKKKEFKINGLGLIHVARIRDKYWEAWQASRQAIEIDLSDCFSPYDCGDEAVWIDQLKKKLSVKGIKTTED